VPLVSPVVAAVVEAEEVDEEAAYNQGVNIVGEISVNIEETKFE